MMKRAMLRSWALGFIFGASCAHAQVPPSGEMDRPPSSSPVTIDYSLSRYALPYVPELSYRANACSLQAAAHHRVNPDILRAILLVESGGRPFAINKNANGTFDIGIAQINSIHLRDLSKFGIRPEHLFDECISIFVAAWHYRKQIDRFGNTWQAVGAYHSVTPVHNTRYQRLVYRKLLSMRERAQAMAFAMGSLSLQGRAPASR
ncbi:MAG: lytic transglycosylase domain-containing protein [Gammaproteobacteria bacterium]|nr:lytic transglycosylase domain-containing protein [Gammaproteobacteria bacterium]